MKKIELIDVDLGVNVEEIIKDSITELTSDAQKQLETVIETSKAVAAVQNKTTEAMTLAYNALLDAGESGLPVSVIMAKISDVISNAGAFTLRMKHMLAEQGNLYILTRIKVHGTPHYKLEPYNLVPDAADSQD